MIRGRIPTGFIGHIIRTDVHNPLDQFDVSVLRCVNGDGDGLQQYRVKVVQQAAVAEVQTEIFPDYSDFSENQAVRIRRTNGFGANEQTDSDRSALYNAGVGAFVYDLIKRFFDLCGAASLLLLLSPVMLAIAAAVKISSSGPVVYRQRRLTRGGKEFTMYKFRTMVTNAEKSSGAVWANVKDVRITAIGRFLRSTRLDELPQLINIILGDMSLIGPRPERPELARDLARELPNFNRRMEVRAGLSGLAQVSSGYAACVDSYRIKLAHDIFYVENRSLLLDLKIALKTVTVVLTAFGAR